MVFNDSDFKLLLPARGNHPAREQMLSRRDIKFPEPKQANVLPVPPSLLVYIVVLSAHGNNSPKSILERAEILLLIQVRYLVYLCDISMQMLSLYKCGSLGHKVTSVAAVGPCRMPCRVSTVPSRILGPSPRWKYAGIISKVKDAIFVSEDRAKKFALHAKRDDDVDAGQHGESNHDDADYIRAIVENGTLSQHFSNKFFRSQMFHASLLIGTRWRWFGQLFATRL